MQIPSLNSRNGFMCKMFFLLHIILLCLGYATLHHLHLTSSTCIRFYWCTVQNICLPQLSVTMGDMSKFDRYNNAQKTKKKHFHNFLGCTLHGPKFQHKSKFVGIQCGSGIYSTVYYPKPRYTEILLQWITKIYPNNQPAYFLFCNIFTLVISTSESVLHQIHMWVSKWQVECLLGKNHGPWGLTEMDFLISYSCKFRWYWGTAYVEIALGIDLWVWVRNIILASRFIVWQSMPCAEQFLWDINQWIYTMLA